MAACGRSARSALGTESRLRSRLGFKVLSDQTHWLGLAGSVQTKPFILIRVLAVALALNLLRRCHLGFPHRGLRKADNSHRWRS